MSDEIAAFIAERDPGLARDLVMVLDQWPAVLSTARDPTGDAATDALNEEWEAAGKERRERLEPFRNDLAKRVGA